MRTIQSKYLSGFTSLILVLIILFVSEDTITFGSAIGDKTVILKLVVYGTALTCLAYRYYKQLLYPRYSGWLYACVCLVLITSVFNFDFRLGYIYQIVVITLSYFITRGIPLENFLKIFSKFILYITYFSLILFIVANCFPAILDMFPVVQNSAGTPITNLYIGSVFRGGSIIRNASIFREPGVFIIYLLFALIIELYYKKKISYIVITTFIFAVITTFSTTGYIFLGFVLVGYFLFKKDKKIRKINIIIVSSVVMLILLISSSFVFEIIFSKFSQDSASYGSMLARVASVFVNYDIFLTYPFWGSGYSNYEEQFVTFSLIRYSLPLESSGQSTNTFMGILAMHGLFLFSIIIRSFYKLTQLISPNKLLHIITFIVFLFLFSTEEMRMSLLFNVLVMYGITSLKSEKILFSKHHCS